MKIFITGLNGFIGKSLKNVFSKKHQILSLTKQHNAIHSESNITEVIGDLSKQNEWKEKIINFSPDYCIHMAWDGLPDYSLEKCILNLNQNILFLDFLCKIKVPNIVFTGSCYEYGITKGKLFEDKIPNKPPLFGITKLSIFNYMENLCLTNNIKFKWARIFYTYGPNQRRNSLIPSIWHDIKFNKGNSIKTP